MRVRLLVLLMGLVAAGLYLGMGLGTSAPTGPTPDPNYDDRWVASFPESLGGFTVTHINTPKDRACMSAPVVHMEASHSSLQEFFSAPPDLVSIKSELQAVSGIPANVRLSFSPSSLDGNTASSKNADWNGKRLERGCLEPWTDRQVDDTGLPRGFAVFQNTDAGNHTNDNGQNVNIRTPSSIGTNQNNWSAAINNVMTNTNYFLQSGMHLESGQEIIGWSIEGGEPDEFQSVPYRSNTWYQFPISRAANGGWFTCAGNNGNLTDEYECIFHSGATGTNLQEHPSTGVWFENANTNATWHNGFPSTISTKKARIYLDGTGQGWSTEDRVSAHNCGGNSYPVSGAMSSTLKNLGTANWKLNGVPLNCP